ncbi:MAG TPA: transglycosylase SLT domain-containing protein, partial [Gallionella sp.]|nr:transglycosylase SLT domain-containing protein [Gallionella sp.]
EAATIFMSLNNEFSFYGQLASDELANTSSPDVKTKTYQPSKTDIAAITALPGAQRALALYRMDLHGDALNEWNWMTRNFNDRELLAAAEVARRNKMYDHAIGTADKTTNLHDFNLRYLAPYRYVAQEYIHTNNLDEAWVYGLMRQESRFVTQANSSVGAAGLMQIMPGTARLMAKKLGLKNYHDALLHQLDTNLKLGIYYMKSILSELDNNPVLASTAYNAGPRRAEQWRADYPLEGAIYIETIPFDETRNYVKKVMSNTMYYARQFGMPTRSLKTRLGTIAGKITGTQPGLNSTISKRAIAPDPAETGASPDDTQAMSMPDMRPSDESAIQPAQTGAEPMLEP